MLGVYGFINRGHLQRMYGMSAQQASKDLQVFMKSHPDLMWYNPIAKRYELVAPLQETNDV